jgi:hypothetical protein
MLIVISALLFAVLATTFAASTFAALFFFMLVPVVATAILTYFADGGANYPTIFRTGIYAAGIAYLLIGMGTAFIFLLFPHALRAGILFLLEFIYLILLGGVILLLGLSTKSASEKEATQLRRLQQVVSLESRLRNLKQQVASGSSEAQGLDKIIDEVRYFDKNSVSQYDSGIAEKLLDLESILLTRDNVTPLEIPETKGLLDMAAKEADGAVQSPASPPPPPPVTDPPQKLIDDIYKLVVARHQDTTRSKRGGF